MQDTNATREHLFVVPRQARPPRWSQQNEDRSTSKVYTLWLIDQRGVVSGEEAAYGRRYFPVVIERSVAPPGEPLPGFLFLETDFESAWPTQATHNATQAHQLHRNRSRSRRSLWGRFPRRRNEISV